MSRHTASCFAEVVFETQTGRYRACFRQHKARGKANGELQHPQHEIADDESGRVLESKLQTVAQHVQTVTGMDFEQFTRSLLLAQGSFAAFLQAGPDERGPILEQITGTERYSDISKQVHKTYVEHQKTRDHLLAQLSQVQPLGREAVEQLHEELLQCEAQEKVFKEEANQYETELARLDRMERLVREQENLLRQEEEWKRNNDDFASDRWMWERACKAYSLQSEYRELCNLRQRKQDEESQLRQSKQRLIDADNKQKQAHSEWQQRSGFVEEKKQQWDQARPHLERAKTLDFHLDTIRGLQRKQYQAAQQKTDADIKKDNFIKELCQIDVTFPSLEKQWDDLQAMAQQNRHAVTKWLGNRKKEAFYEERSRQQRSQQLLVTLTKLREKWQQKKNKYNDLLEKQTQWEARAEALAGFLQDAQENQAVLEQAALAATTLTQMATARMELQDGVACLLCGSLDHPFVREPNRLAGRLEAEKKQAIDDERRMLQTQVDAWNQELAQVRAGLRHNTEDQGICQQEILHCQAEIQQVLLDLGRSADVLQVSMQHIDLWSAELEAERQHTDKVLESVAQLEQEWEGLALEKHRREYEDRLQKRQTAEIQKNHAEEMANKEAEAWRGLDAERREAEVRAWASLHPTAPSPADSLYFSDSNGVSHAYRNLVLMRKQWFAGSDPAVEEARLRKLYEEAQHDTVIRQKVAIAADTQVLLCRTEVEARERAVASCVVGLDAMEQQVQSLYESNGFVDERDFQDACLSEEQRDNLGFRHRQLQKDHDQWQAVRDRCDSELQALQRNPSAHSSREAMTECLAETRTALDVLQKRMGSIAHQLEQHKTQQAQQQECVVALQQHSQVLARWSVLHDLMGSADGKKYRNFVQGLAFEQLVFYANVPLRTMTDRYELKRDTSQPLALQLVDHYQADAVRSTKNVSGGEGFLVSLALALGLSNMVRKKVRMDTLFVDEGFGTLDEETLEMALDTLAGLQREGKLIGIISHVSALQERITTQIRVIPQAGGVSVLQGPGCTRG